MVAHYNKKQQIDGIVCDLCGKVHTEQFQYYSGKFDFVVVDRNIQKQGAAEIDKRFLDVDICVECWKDFENKMRKNLEKLQSQGSWSTQTNSGQPTQFKQRMKP